MKQHGPDAVRLGNVQRLDQRMLELSNRGPEEVVGAAFTIMLGDYLRAGGDLKDFRMEFTDPKDPWDSGAEYPFEGLHIRLMGWKRA